MQSTTSEAPPATQPQTSSSSGPSVHNAEVNETSTLLYKADSRSSRDPLVDGDDTAQDVVPNIPHSDVRGLAMLAKLEFWQLFLVMALLSGIGLMTIKYVSFAHVFNASVDFSRSNIGNSVWAIFPLDCKTRF